MTPYEWMDRVCASDLEGPTRLVLYALARHMKPEDAFCWPSIARLADVSGLSERAVRRHLGLAERDGWVLVRRDPRKRAVNRYSASVPDPTPGPLFEGAEAVAPELPRVHHAPLQGHDTPLDRHHAPQELLQRTPQEKKAVVTAAAFLSQGEETPACPRHALRSQKRKGSRGDYYACPHYRAAGRGRCDFTVDAEAWEQERAQRTRRAIAEAAQNSVRPTRAELIARGDQSLTTLADLKKAKANPA